MSAPTKRNRKISQALDGLISQMEAMSFDAVDAEVCKRFRQLLDKNEISVNAEPLRAFVANPEDSEIANFPDEIRPFLRHFRFMRKRQK